MLPSTLFFFQFVDHISAVNVILQCMLLTELKFNLLACIVCESCRVYVTVRCTPVRPVGPTATNPLLWARWAGDIDRLLHGRRSAAAAGECGQCHVVSVRSKPNADCFTVSGYSVQITSPIFNSTETSTGNNIILYCHVFRKTTTNRPNTFQ